MISNEESFIISELDLEIRQLKSENDRLRGCLEEIEQIYHSHLSHEKRGSVSLLSRDFAICTNIAKQALKGE